MYNLPRFCFNLKTSPPVAFSVKKENDFTLLYACLPFFILILEARNCFYRKYKTPLSPFWIFKQWFQHESIPRKWFVFFFYFVPFFSIRGLSAIWSYKWSTNQMLGIKADIIRETQQIIFCFSATSSTGASSSFQMEDLSFSNSALTCVNCLAQKSYFFFPFNSTEVNQNTWRFCAQK